MLKKVLLLLNTVTILIFFHPLIEAASVEGQTQVSIEIVPTSVDSEKGEGSGIRQKFPQTGEYPSALIIMVGVLLVGTVSIVLKRQSKKKGDTL